jgi:hypothetical protein
MSQMHITHVTSMSCSDKISHTALRRPLRDAERWELLPWGFSRLWGLLGPLIANQAPVEDSLTPSGQSGLVCKGSISLILLEKGYHHT